MLLNETKYKSMKNEIWSKKGDIKSSHIDQAIACGLGFKDYYALRQEMLNGGIDYPKSMNSSNFSVSKFLSRLKEFGYSLERSSGRDINPVFSLAGIIRGNIDDTSLVMFEAEVDEPDWDEDFPSICRFSIMRAEFLQPRDDMPLSGNSTA